MFEILNANKNLALNVGCQRKLSFGVPMKIGPRMSWYMALGDAKGYWAFGKEIGLLEGCQ
jgi:hypothetical protein